MGGILYVSAESGRAVRVQATTHAERAKSGHGAKMGSSRFVDTHFYMNFKYFSKNGVVRPMGGATIPLANIEYQYGFGVYENIRVEKAIPFFLKDHLERLRESARIIGLEHGFDEAIIGKSVAELVEKSGAGTYNLKIILIGAKAPENAALCILPLNPHFPDKKLYRDGVHLSTYEYERPFPHAKTLNMLQSYLAYKKVQEEGAYDALLINSKGCITEGTRTNFFCMQGKVLFTPPEEEILLGVTRKVVLFIAKANGFEVRGGEMAFSDLSRADGAFITSTSSKILPVKSVDSFVLPEVPEILRDLMRAVDDFYGSCGGVLT